MKTKMQNDSSLGLCIEPQHFRLIKKLNLKSSLHITLIKRKKIIRTAQVASREKGLKSMARKFSRNNKRCYWTLRSVKVGGGGNDTVDVFETAAATCWRKREAFVLDSSARERLLYQTTACKGDSNRQHHDFLSRLF